MELKEKDHFDFINSSKATGTYNGVGFKTIYEDNTVVKSFMLKVYAWMSIALCLTGFVSLYVANSPDMINTLITNRLLFWGVILSEFGLVIYLSARLQQISLMTATFCFLLYSILTGVMLSTIFIVYSAHSITLAFFVTAGTFVTMSIVGAVTKKDLSNLGSILYMAIIGLIISSVVNMFLHSSSFDWLISFGGVAIFTALTAYDSQRIKRMATIGTDSSIGNKYAIMGALTLYLDFINLFLYLLRFLGNRR